jgi:hypothetical protein
MKNLPTTRTGLLTLAIVASVSFIAPLQAQTQSVPNNQAAPVTPNSNPTPPSPTNQSPNGQPDKPLNLNTNPQRPYVNPNAGTPVIVAPTPPDPNNNKQTAPLDNGHVPNKQEKGKKSAKQGSEKD